jgi:hypothetical protein
VIFGGIQDVTKELNDIYAFSITECQWSKIHSNSNSVYECSPTMKRSLSKKVINLSYRKNKNKAK